MSASLERSPYLRALRSLPPAEAAVLLSAIIDRWYCLGAQDGQHERGDVDRRRFEDRLTRKRDEARRAIAASLREAEASS